MKYRHLLLFLVVSYLLVRCGPTNRVTIINESGQTAHDVRIEVGGETMDLRDILTGATASVRFGTPSQDDYVTIRCRLQDGTVIGESCVYVAWEMYFYECVIVIREDGNATQRY